MTRLNVQHMANVRGIPLPAISEGESKEFQIAEKLDVASIEA